MVNQSDLDTVEMELIAEPAEIKPPDAFSSLVKVDFGAVSHVGKVRANNEDHFRIARTNRSVQTVKSNLPPGQIPDRFEEVGYGMVVADGMGGAAAGDVASMLAITIGVNLRLDQAKWNLKINDDEARDLIDRACRIIRAVDEQVSRLAHSDPALMGMGTTLTVAYSVGDRLFVFHVGDSRAYLHRQGRLRQLTRDHTLAQDLADAGKIAPEEVATSRLRHVLTNVIGGEGGQVYVELADFGLRDGDGVLLCTDGLTEMVDDDAICDVLDRIADSGQACQRLVDLALNNGGRDNITVLLARYRMPERPA